MQHLREEISLLFITVLSAEAEFTLGKKTEPPERSKKRPEYVR